MRRWLSVCYEIAMAALAIVVVFLTFTPETPAIRNWNIAIWGVFVADYVARLALAKDRRRFVRENVVDLVTILPVDFLPLGPATSEARLVRALRLLRLLRLLRAGAVLWRVTAHMRGILKTNGLGYVLLVNVGVVLLGSVAIRHAEPLRFHSFVDGLWWSLVTATTVGYGDIAPRELEGRLVAAVLMIVGIGTISMITGSIATYFLGHGRSSANPHVRHVQSQLARWDEMSAEERRQSWQMLRTLAEGAED